MRSITASTPSLTEGVDSLKIAGQPVKVYNPAKTVIECFRYRRHVGLDVALEAMCEVLRERRCTPDAIARCATRCGVASVVRPYLEAMA